MRRKATQAIRRVPFDAVRAQRDGIAPLWAFGFCGTFGASILDIRHSIPSKKKMAELSRPTFSFNLIADAEDVLYNRRVKINPLNGEVLEDCCCSKPIFNPTGAVLRGDVCKSERDDGDGGDGSSRVRGAARARKEVFELCACNVFDLFFTLTLSPEKVDRYDYKEAVKKLGQWLDNRVRRKGLRYVAVPELHRDGAVHFHGLCNAESMRLVDSGHSDKGHPIYNVSDWPLGFTTAMRLYGEPLRAARYIAKYVTKSADGGTIGGRYYFHGGALDKARCLYYHEDYGIFDGKEILLPDAPISFKYA